jgi:hypothetical protein
MKRKRRDSMMTSGPGDQTGTFICVSFIILKKTCRLDTFAANGLHLLVDRTRRPQKAQDAPSKELSSSTSHCESPDRDTEATKKNSNGTQLVMAVASWRAASLTSPKTARSPTIFLASAKEASRAYTGRASKICCRTMASILPNSCGPTPFPGRKGAEHR